MDDKKNREMLEELIHAYESIGEEAQRILETIMHVCEIWYDDESAEAVKEMLMAGASDLYKVNQLTAFAAKHRKKYNGNL